MIAALAFTIVAALLVYQAGRRDAARDPRLTIGLLVLSAILPALVWCLPKIEVLPAGEGAVSTEASFSWGKLLLKVWVLGFVWRMSRLSVELLTIRGWLHGSQEIMRVGDVSIRICDRITSPVAVGVLRKAVLVPAAWTTWPEETRGIVLDHELAHHERRDPLWRILTAIARAVHWYQPMVGWMARRFVMQSEFACDTAVLRGGVAPKAYARVLCDVAAGASPSPLAAAMAERSSLETRVRRMMAAAPPVKPAVPLAVCGVLGLLAACSFAMMARKQPESRTAPADEAAIRLSADPFPGNP
jgi:beta-lactamase regulating signal transducer with metallopeptidase domain